MWACLLATTLLGSLIALGASPPRIRVPAAVQSRKLIYDPPPVYPEKARKAHIGGIVRLNVLIGTDGWVLALRLVSGHALLVPAAMEAVKHWMWRRTFWNDQPAEVITQVDVSFPPSPPKPVRV